MIRETHHVTITAVTPTRLGADRQRYTIDARDVDRDLPVQFVTFNDYRATRCIEAKNGDFSLLISSERKPGYSDRLITMVQRYRVNEARS